MKNYNRYYKKIFAIVILFGVFFLKNTDYFYSVYFAIGGMGIICLAITDNGSDSRIEPKLLIVSLVLSMMVLLPNYRLFMGGSIEGNAVGKSEILYGVRVAFFICAGMAISFYYIILEIMRIISNSVLQNGEERNTFAKPFFSSFLIIFSCYFIAFSLAFYPGIISTDSVTEIKEALYMREHHSGIPIIYSALVNMCIRVGMFLFGNVNSAVAVYSVMQIIIVALAFSYGIATLYQVGINVKVLVGIILYCVLMPYHILYSFTMWKDVVYSICLLIFTIALYRYQNSIGNTWISCASFFLSGLGMCLFRFNGFYSFILMIVLLVFALGIRENYKTIMSVCVIAIVSYAISHAVLSNTGNSQMGLLNTMCIPSQQISRVVTECDDLTDEDIRLLSNLIDLDEVSEKYDPHISDPVLRIVCSNKDGVEFFNTHKNEYLKMYIRLGIKHPLKYIFAWIDQTNGYWNGGNDYWKWLTIVDKNDFGCENYSVLPWFKTLYLYYFGMYMNTHYPILQLLVSIGLSTWLIVLVLFFGIIRRRKDIICATIPALSVIIILLVCTPVWSEFRYAYSNFCCLPFLLGIVLKTDNTPGLEII